LDRHRPTFDSDWFVLFRLFDLTTFPRGIFCVRLRSVVLEFALAELSWFLDSLADEKFFAFICGLGSSQTHATENAIATATHDATFSLKLNGSDRNDHAKLRSRTMGHLHEGTTRRSLSVILLNGELVA